MEGEGRKVRVEYNKITIDGEWWWCDEEEEVLKNNKGRVKMVRLGKEVHQGEVIGGT